MNFNHENLHVYQRMLSFNVKVSAWTNEWDSKHAICDQLSRAAESMLENVAVASAAYSSSILGISHESVIKLAARLDLYVAQDLLPWDEGVVWKALLQRVSVMTSAMIESAGMEK